MAGTFNHPDVVTIPDDPAVTAAGGITPTKFNKALKLSGGSDKQLVVRSTAADGTTGMDLTSTPTVSYIVLPMNVDPADLPNGGVTFIDDGVTFGLYARKLNGDLVSLVFG